MIFLNIQHSNAYCYGCDNGGAVADQHVFKSIDCYHHLLLQSPTENND
jgi:hypothetical protein